MMSKETKLGADDAQLTAQVRAKRVSALRRMTCLSRRAFQERYGVAPSSLQNWEDAKGNGLTEKGARKIIALLKPDGIICSFEWLMYGIGPGPQIVSDKFYSEESSAAQTDKESISEDAQLAVITQELLLFHRTYPKVGIDFIVPDRSMEPRFLKGDYVAGCRRHGRDIEHLVGLDCIVQTEEGDLLVRTIKRLEPDGRYTLACYNLNVEKPFLYHVSLLMAAPIIWTRRLDYK